MQPTVALVSSLALLFVAGSAHAWAPDRNDRQWPLAALGRPCADAAGAQHLRWLCDASGRVAGVAMPADALHVDLSAGRELLVWRESTTLRGRSLSVHALSGVLIVQDVTCGRCARVMGHAYVLRLASVRDADLAEVQRALGLAPSPLLRTEAHWRAALARLHPGG